MSENLSTYCENMKVVSCNIKGGRYMRHGDPKGFQDFVSSLPLKIIKVFSKGKCLVIEFENENYLYNTLGMSGGWSHIKNKHSNVEFCLVNSENINTKDLYFDDPRNFGQLKFLNSKKKIDEILENWGYDILSENTKLEHFIKMYKKYPNQNITKFLMNQKIMSGIGNYIKCESLYRSKISPEKNIGELSEQEIEVLFNNLKKVCKDSYNSQGNTILHYKDFDGNIGNFKSMLKVYGREYDDNGYKVLKSKFKDGRTTHWVKEIQY